jgi:hypothetical protein
MNCHEDQAVNLRVKAFELGSSRSRNKSSNPNGECGPRCVRTKYFDSLGIKKSQSSGNVIPLKLTISDNMRALQEKLLTRTNQRRMHSNTHHLSSSTEMTKSIQVSDEACKPKLRSISFDQTISLKLAKNSKPAPPCMKVQHSIINNSVTSEKGCRKGRTVSFDDSVSVHPIPTRHQYPLQVRKEIWSCKREMLYNMKRNVTEFAAEGWNWKHAVEDHEMILGQNGELIHPVHILQSMCQFSIKQRFLQLHAAARWSST